MSVELAPCEKCGGMGKPRASRDGDVEWIRCVMCGHEGPLALSYGQAAEAWNRRTPDTIARLTAEPAGEDVEATIADAIERADAGYRMELTRLVNGESTYTLTYGDGSTFKFPNTDELYEHVRETKRKAQAKAVLAAIAFQPPTDDLRRTREAELEAEIERLRGLLVDPGDPAWEDARAILVAELRKAEMPDHARAVAEGQGAYIPSWMALNLIALSTVSKDREHG